MTKVEKHVMATWRTAWRTLNKADTLLMAIPASQPLAKDVMAIMLKLDNLIERQQRKRR